MQIVLDSISKRYASQPADGWVLKNLTCHFSTGDKVAIIGNNGSGKTTLLKIIAGMVLPSGGSITYHVDDQAIPPEEIYQSLSFAAPYLELIEEFTLMEFLKFHFQFKNLKTVSNISEFITDLYFEGQEDKPIRNFSSGMKQRLKLGLCFYSSSRVILLDEPTTNLDTIGTEWYHRRIASLASDQLLIVASNQKYEYEFCNNIIDLNRNTDVRR